MKTKNYLQITLLILFFLVKNNVAYCQELIVGDTFPKRCPFFEKKVFDYVNQYRVKNGLQPVTWSEQVYKAATNHAVYLSKIEGITHFETKNVNNFDEKKGFISRISYFVPNPSMVGEIIVNCSFWGFRDSAYLNSIPVAIVEAWKESKGHNEVMITEGYTQGAVAIYLDNTESIKPVFIFVRK